MQQMPPDGDCRTPLRKHGPAGRGFTLLELSIVLTVIALIVGGVLVGRDLMRSAALRQLGSQIDSYNSAVNTFQSKYGCLPGDCNKAESLFGTSNGTGSGPCPTSSYFPTAGTCNGDGDGKLTIPPGFDPYDEGLRLWEQLSLAKLIQGSYHTFGYSGNYPGTASPRLPSGLSRGSANIRVYWRTNSLFTPPMPQGHIFVVGIADQANTNSKAVLSPFEANWYDSKFDDGLPKSGNVQAAMYNWGSYVNIYSNCFSGTQYVSSDVYNFTNNPTGDGCPLFISASF